MPTFASDTKGARIAVIERGRRAGLTWDQIAEQLGGITAKGLSAWWSAQTRIHQRNANRANLRKPDGPPPSTAKRACLRCQKMFDSEGAHNRICAPCKGNR